MGRVGPGQILQSAPGVAWEQGLRKQPVVAVCGNRQKGPLAVAGALGDPQNLWVLPPQVGPEGTVPRLPFPVNM